MKMWSLHEDCRNIISNCWQNRVVGFPMFVLNKKLKLLKEQLKIWNKEIFGNVHDMVQIAEDKVAEIQTKIQSLDYNEELMNQEKQAQFFLEEALKKQNWFW